MKFISLALKNLTRNKLRTSLTLLGVALYAANVAATMAEGVERAREALASGRAAERLTQFVARAQQLAA